jgi:hypothetical protein
VKYYLTAYAIVASIFVSLAQSPALQQGVSNIYTYTEMDGLSESNVAFVGKDTHGKVYAQAYNGQTYIIGNNYCRTVKYPTGTSSDAISTMREIEGRQYLFGSEFVYRLSADTIDWFCRIPPGFQGLDVLKSVLYFSCVDTGFFKVYLFHQQQFKLIHRSPASNATVQLCSYDDKGILYKIDYTPTQLDFHQVVGERELQPLFSVKAKSAFLPIFYLGSLNEWYVATSQQILRYNNGQLSSIISTGNRWQPSFNSIYFVSSIIPGFSSLKAVGNSVNASYIVPHSDKLIGAILRDSVLENFYLGSFNKPFRFFPYLKQHPRIFQKSRSAGIHAITQDNKNRVLAASYEGGIAIIDSSGIIEHREPGLNFLPNALNIDGYNYFIAENFSQGLQQYSNDGKRKTIKNNITGFYQYKSLDGRRYYFGTSSTKCLLTDVASLQKGKPVWLEIDSSRGYRLANTISITEDTFGRAWMSHSSKGWAVFYPDKKIATTFLISNKQTDFGFLSSCTDDKGTVWLGSRQRGLLYYNSYGVVVRPEDVKEILHPLLVKGASISQLIQWGKWLLIGAEDKMLLLDLDVWYKKKEVLLRYLNPQETGFTSRLEQNTILTNTGDSCVWFATSTMLYQWNIRKWLALPTFKVLPNLVLNGKSKDSILIESKAHNLHPTDNSLSFSIWFQSRDNMPRYMTLALAKDGDSTVFNAPSLQTTYRFDNLAPGAYTVHMQICETDGTVAVHRYPIIINKFWWQYWWTWLLMVLTVFTPLVLLLNAKRKQAIQQKRLTQLNIVTLSNQFRPHFILNALNTIGADLNDKPEAEAVISRLGESIDLIFKHAQQKKTFHMLAEEWSLVENVIAIHRLMYLPQLEFDVPTKEWLQEQKTLKVPLGILQIAVENALLHGLRNKSFGPYRLTIIGGYKNNSIFFEINDNGIGRKRAMEISSYKKHGTGTKNLFEVLAILNYYNVNKITVEYKDDVYNEQVDKGTCVIISIPINFRYEY